MIGIGSFLQLEKQECRSNVCFQFMVFPIPKSVAELSFFGESLQLHKREERKNHSSSLSSSANQDPFRRRFSFSRKKKKRKVLDHLDHLIPIILPIHI